MKKKIIASILIIILTLCPISTSAKATRYYTMTGTIKNFTYTMRYTDGTVLKGKGFDIYTTDGNIWEMTDTDADYAFAESQRVKVKFDNNGTPKDKTDDIIISVKKAK